METNLKKLLPIVGVMLAGLTSVNAADYSSDDDMTSAKKSYQSKPLPSSAHHHDEAYGVMLGADYILWTPRDNAISGVTGVYSGGSASPTKGSVQRPDYKLYSGFRVRLGASLDHDDWMAEINYTWLRPNKSNTPVTAAANTDTTLYFAYVLDPAGSGTVDRGNQIYQTYKQQYNVIDLQLSRPAFHGHYFAVDAGTALRFAWNRYDETIEARTDAVTAGTNVTWRNTHTQKLFGIGPRGHMNVDFFFNDSWVLFSNLAMSGLWSKFDMEQKQQDLANSLTTYHFDNDFKQVTPVADFGLGLRWQSTFGDTDQYRAALSAGWEMQNWWNQYNFIDVNEGSTPGTPVTYNGLTVKFAFDF